MTNRLAVLIAIALATPVLAGCVGSSDEPLDDHGNGIGGRYPPPVVRTPLAVAISADALWVKPGESITLEATPPAGASGDVTYTWSIGALPDGWGETGGDEDGEHAHGEGAMLDTGDIAGGAFSEPMAFTEEGIFVFHCHPHPWMKARVIVRDGADLTGTAHVAILDGETSESYRFAPEEVVIAPGASVVWWNNGTHMHTATQEAHEPLLDVIDGATGATLTFTPAADGDFRIVVEAKDAETGYGKAEMRLLVDSGKPDALKTFEPKTGSFTAALAGQSPSAANRFSYLLDHRIVALTVEFETSSPLPMAEATVTLVDAAGETLGVIEGAERGTIQALDIPAGQYSVVVTPVQGVAVEYTVAVTAELDLVPPAPGAHGDGHAHHH